MKNKKKKNKDFSSIKTKIFLQTILMVLGAIVFVWFSYNAIIYAKFGNWFVYVLEHFFKMEYYDALTFYHDHVQRYSGTIIELTMAALFFIIFFEIAFWFMHTYGGKV